MNDPLDDALWCVWTILRCRRRIRNPRHPTGLVVAEINAILELHLILEEVGWNKKS